MSDERVRRAVGSRTQTATVAGSTPVGKWWYISGVSREMFAIIGVGAYVLTMLWSTGGFKP